MTTLDELGFTSSDILETVLTTYSQKKIPHGCALGVKKVGKEKIGFKLFVDTQSYQNLSNKKAGVINLVADAKIIVKLGLSEIFQEREEIEFREAKKVDAPCLSGCAATVEFDVADMRKKSVSDSLGESKAVEFVGRPENINVENAQPQVFKRSDFFLIESAILASRVIGAMDKGKVSIANKKMKEVERYLEKCEKISPNSSRRNLIAKILKYLKEKG